MTVIPGSVRVAGFIAPTDSTDTYAVHDDAYGRGGWRTVNNITERNSITADRRKAGMAVRVLDDGYGVQKFYTLAGGIEDGNWIEDNIYNGSIESDLTMYVDGYNGDDGYDGLSWETAKKTLGFLVKGESDALPRCINAEVIINVRGPIRARSSSVPSMHIIGFYGSGTLSIIGEKTVVETFTASNYENSYTVKGSLQWMSDGTKNWEPGQWRRHFVDVGHIGLYPIRNNNATTIFTSETRLLTGTPSGTIYSCPEILSEIASNPGEKVDFATLFNYPFITISFCDLSINIENLWCDESASITNSLSIYGCSKSIDLDNISLAGAFITETEIVSFYSFYFLLNEYSFCLTQSSKVFLNYGAIDSSDLTGYGIYFDVHSLCSLYRVWVGNQKTAIWIGPFAQVFTQDRNYVQSCEDAVMLFSGSLYSEYPLSGYSLRFDDVYRAIVGSGSLIRSGSSQIIGWDVISEIVFSDVDLATFEEFNLGTLKGRSDLSIQYMDSDYKPVLLNEYNNTTSGLDAYSYQTAIDELALIAVVDGYDGYVQFNNNGSFGSDGYFFWDNENKNLKVPSLSLGIENETGTVIIGANPTTTSWDFYFPENAGVDGYVLTTDGNGITSWTQVESGDSGPIAPEVCLISPRVISDADHGKILMVGAFVIGGFQFTLPLSPTPGLTITIGTPGLTTKVLTTAPGLILGQGLLSSGVTELRTSEPGYGITLTYISGNNWGATDGIGSWMIYSGGSPTDTYVRFSPYISDGGAGNVVVIGGNGQLEDGGVGINDLGIPKTTFSRTAIELTDNYTFTLVESTLATDEAICYSFVSSPSTNVGQVIVNLYQDVNRTELVYEKTIDLSDAYSWIGSESFGFSTETTGTLYGTLYCSAIPISSTIDISIEALSISPTISPVPLPGPYGDGIEDDGFGNPQIALFSSGGLEFSTGQLKIKPDVTSSSTVSLGAGGLSVTGVVDLVNDQSVLGQKLFDSSGLIPQDSYGPPTGIGGPWENGIEILDAYGIKWRYFDDNWELADVVTEYSDVFVSDPVSDGYSTNISIPVTGNVGQCLWLRVWARRETGTAEIQIPFRIKISETSDYRGRELVYSELCLARQTYITGSLPASQTYMDVNSNDLFDVDELVCIYDSDNRFEIGRISARPTGQITLSEALEDSETWDVNSLVLGVTELWNVPWINRDGSLDNQNKILIQIRHDGVSSDPDLVFYVQVLAQSRGFIK